MIYGDSAINNLGLLSLHSKPDHTSFKLNSDEFSSYLEQSMIDYEEMDQEKEAYLSMELLGTLLSNFNIDLSKANINQNIGCEAVSSKTLNREDIDINRNMIPGDKIQAHEQLNKVLDFMIQNAEGESSISSVNKNQIKSIMDEFMKALSLANGLEPSDVEFLSLTGNKDIKQQLESFIVKLQDIYSKKDSNSKELVNLLEYKANNGSVEKKSLQVTDETNEIFIKQQDNFTNTTNVKGHFTSGDFTMDKSNLASSEKENVQSDLPWQLSEKLQENSTKQTNIARKNTVRGGALIENKEDSFEQDFNLSEMQDLKQSLTFNLNTDEKAVDSESFADRVQELGKTIKDNIIKSTFLSDESGNKEFEIQLKPEHLGKIIIRLQSTHKGMDIKILTSNHEVKDILGAQLLQIENSIKDQGVQLNNINIIHSDLANDFSHSFAGNNRYKELKGKNESKAIKEYEQFTSFYDMAWEVKSISLLDGNRVDFIA